MIRPPPRSPLFPYTTLSRSARGRAASPRERAYIEALAKRYAPIPPADRAALDAAYAAAMGDVVKRYPNDLDAATLYAEALMDKRLGVQRRRVQVEIGRAHV